MKNKFLKTIAELFGKDTNNSQELSLNPSQSEKDLIDAYVDDIYIQAAAMHSK